MTTSQDSDDLSVMINVNKVTILISQLILGYVIFNNSHNLGFGKPLSLEHLMWAFTFLRIFKNYFTHTSCSKSTRSHSLMSRLVSGCFCYSGDHVPSHSSLASLICALTWSFSILWTYQLTGSLSWTLDGSRHWRLTGDKEIRPGDLGWK